MEKLPNDYIAGFVDGEGCFALKFRRDIRHKRPNKPVYFYWDIEFAIVLRSDDKQILEKIQKTMNCGKISLDKRNTARYSVNDIHDLSNKIVPFFKKYRLYAKKKFDFILWKEAVKIFKRNQRIKINRKPGDKWFHKIKWNRQDIQRLKAIHEAMRKYKSRGRAWKWL